MNEINTIMEPFVWNYTQYKGTNFSRLLLIDTDMTGAEYNLEITGAKGTILPEVKVIKIENNTTLLGISLTAKQTAMMANQNKWVFKITFKGETFLCWIGQFNLKVAI